MNQCKDKHNPDVWVNNTSQVHQTTKCLDCGERLISIANSRWMTNEEHRRYILQEHHGVDNEI